MSVVFVGCGLALVSFVFLEAFEALVLPRRVLRSFRFTRLYYRSAWRVWVGVARVTLSAQRKQTLLSMFGPLSLLILFAIWAAALIVGYGLMHHGLEPHEGGFAEALYLSGTTFTTLGYGDLTPKSHAGRALSVAEAATGLGFFAVVISYLPVLYQAFGQRESFIAILDARAGSPPAAARLILRTPPVGDGAACLTQFLVDAERWSAELLEAHLSFPVLGYYRSQHDNQSWLAALACALDTSALLLTVVESGNGTQARLTFAMARHAAVDLGLVMRRPPADPESDRFPPGRLAEWFAALRGMGGSVRDDAASVGKLVELRRLYEPFLVGLGIYFRLPLPAVWPTGDGPDNWQTSAWLRQAGPLASLGIDPKDEHF